jgi:hypothetical protein
MSRNRLQHCSIGMRRCSTSDGGVRRHPAAVRHGRLSYAGSQPQDVGADDRRLCKEPISQDLAGDQGRKCFGKTPMQTFLDAVAMTKEKPIAA